MKLTEKELTMINDALEEEDRLVKKFQCLSSQAKDEAVRSAFTEIAQKHQGHFNEIYEQLK